MKRIVLAALLSVSTPVMALSVEFCTHISEVSGQYMTIRQSGAPLSYAFEVADNLMIKIEETGRGKPEERFKNIIREIVLGAYEKPFLYGAEPFRADYINEYSSKWMLKCLRSEYPFN